MDLGGLLLLLLLAGTLALALLAWVRRVAAAAVVGVVAGTALTALVLALGADGLHLDGRRVTTVLAVLAGGLAVAGGGPLTSRVFDLVDGPRHRTDQDSVTRAGEVLRGGAWIGCLERAAVFAALATGMPGGVAVVLGLKGLGRYPELRTGERAGAAERFIIGTFTSVLWAGACAGLVLLARA
ncbi:MAG: hypothetical protein ACXVWZ_08395 [Nocardioides sp.]